MELKHKNEDADKLIQVVGIETDKVSREKAIADEEELKVQVINVVSSAHCFSCLLEDGQKAGGEQKVRGLLVKEPGFL